MIEQLLIGCGMSVLCGLDRTALLQSMLSRPVVAAPLTGILLGNASAGLAIGALLELLWLGRLPMGAAIPPDDTQIAVAATFLASVAATFRPSLHLEVTILALLVAMPLGKVGVFFDHWARRRNASLPLLALEDVSRGELSRLDALHRRGLLHFAQSSLATFLVIVICGGGVLYLFVARGNILLERLDPSWLTLLFPLVGISHLLANLNVKRALTLFGSAFFMGYLILWLM